MSDNYVSIKMNPWTEIEVINPDNMSLAIGDRIIVKTEGGLEVGEIAGFGPGSGEEEAAKGRKVIRKLTSDDAKKQADFDNKKKEADIFCRKMIKKHALPMKLVDIFFSFDGGRITFAFVADGRVDFRDLVKDLTRHFQKSIRLQQIGMRDEAKRVGGFGPCGRPMCCMRFKKELGNITTDLARDQQIAHRGSDRLSGVCGRLMCCLSFEEYLYKELSTQLPALESEIKTKQGRGKVISWNVLKQSCRVILKDGTIVEVPLAPKEKKQKNDL